jgi:hypothetical protein
MIEKDKDTGMSQIDFKCRMKSAKMWKIKIYKAAGSIENRRIVSEEMRGGNLSLLCFR